MSILLALSLLAGVAAMALAYQGRKPPQLRPIPLPPMQRRLPPPRPVDDTSFAPDRSYHQW